MPPEQEQPQSETKTASTAKRLAEAESLKEAPIAPASPLFLSAYNIQQAQTVEQPKPQASATEDLGRSFAYSMLQGPVDGLTQIIDNTLNTDTYSAMHFLDAPAPAEFGTARWTAQQVGSTAGAILPFLLAHKAVKATFGSPTEITARSLPLAEQASLRVRDMALTGGMYGTLLTPTDRNSQSFWSDRLKNGGVSALTFSTMAATGVGVQQLGKTMGSRVLASSLTANTIAGLPAGIAHADASALVNQGRFATGQERAQSAFTFAATGALFALGEAKLDQLTTPKTKTQVITLLGDKGGRTPVSMQVPDLVARVNAGNGSGASALELGGTSRQSATAFMALGLKDAALQTAHSEIPSHVVIPKEARLNGSEVSVQVPKESQPNTAGETAKVPSENRYISDVTTPDGVRVIVKENGVKVTISGGKSTVEFPPGFLKPAVKPAPPETVETQPRAKRPDPPDYSHLPLEERPVNVGSKSADAAEKQMSNFEHSPFKLDGREFASVEGFYVWLKWSGDPVKQAIAQTLHGGEAKAFGKPSKATTAEYDGTVIKLGSPEHHALIKRAIQAKLEAHPDIARNFVATYPRPIIHDLGYPEDPKTRLPSKDFARILTELRGDLATGKIVTKDGPVTFNVEQAKEPPPVEQPIDGDTPPVKQEGTSVSDLLRSLAGKRVSETHPVQVYARAFEGFDQQVNRVIGSGGDSIAMELVDGNVLKVTNRRLDAVVGTRWFDMPMLEKGTRDAGGGLTLHYFVQPRALTPVSEALVREFKTQLAATGYSLTDSGQQQLGIYDGKVKLLDPFAVTRID